MRFIKMEGWGNDFVVLEGIEPEGWQVRDWCDRRRGIGADGVLTMDESLVMRYWNADGGAAEMCGNGLRCLARLAVERGWAPPGEWFSIATPVGPRRVHVSDTVATVEVGAVEVGDEVEIQGVRFRRASIGNPHAVTLVDDPEAVDVAGLGASVGTDPVFPRGSNVEFVTVESPGRIRLRVWERGVGETTACGSGMVAAAAVATHPADGEEVQVIVRGGVGRVHFEQGSGFLQGPARTVFTGTLIRDDAAR